MNPQDIKYSIHYRNHTPEKSDGFYHPDSPVLFAVHNKITSVEDCPFPLKTDTFQVLLYGVELLKPATFVVVEYRKGCGHLVQEQVRFEEDVEDFDHYGTKFTGASYSVNDWEKRIEFFRKYPCAVCQLVKHSLWIYSIGESDGGNSRKKAERALLRLLDYNFSNWQEFVKPEVIHQAFLEVRWGQEITLEALYDGQTLRPDGLVEHLENSEILQLEGK